MLAGIFKLLQLEAKLVVAVMGLVIKAAIWLVGFLTRLIPNKSHQPAALQPETQPSPPKPVENLPAIPRNVESPTPQPEQPPIHVTVNLSPGGNAGPRSKMDAVLGNTDHAIYIAGINDMVAPHPRGPELLEALDHMMFVAAHKDGDPFSLPPELDSSAEASDPLPALALDMGFDKVPARALPPADGVSWMIQAGMPAVPMPEPRLRKVKAPAPAPASVLLEPKPELVPESAEFQAGHVNDLPPQDGKLWFASVGQPFKRVPASKSTRSALLST